MTQKSDPIEFWKTCNTFEKIVFVLAQAGACAIPFTLLAMCWKTSIALCVIAFASLVLLGQSKKRRTGENFSISIMPKINLFNKKNDDGCSR